MTALADLACLTTAPETGAPILTVRRHGYKLLGGAALYDLVDRGKLGRTGEGRASRVVVLDPSPVPEPSLEYGLARVRGHGEQWPRNAVLRLGGGVKLREGIYGGLAAEGVLGRRERAGLFSPDRYRVLDVPRRDNIIGHLHAALLEGYEPHPATRRLAALLTVGDPHAGPLLDIVLDWPGSGQRLSGSARSTARKHATASGMEMAKHDWIALTTLRAILLPQQIAQASAVFGIADTAIPK
ncbi:GOLPH3/VPS74 family protein [Georgenia deserti]|uniref:GPP34 family phosphoprotein n=1 Tax=Georgenia deserti TaxID=2093781 RepID=A0ABW4L6B7_9MICO